MKKCLMIIAFVLCIAVSAICVGAREEEPLKPVSKCGTLTIEDADIVVDLYYADMTKPIGDTCQQICDMENAAAFMDFHDAECVIGDHNYQEFKTLKKCVEGETIATITTGDYTQSFLCKKKTNGVNLGTTILDFDANYIEKTNEGGFATYTCTNVHKLVLIYYWEPLQESDM